MSGGALVLRGDARTLPLPDDSVDLIVTSPPYFALRSYRDEGEHYHSQIGSEPTPAEFLEQLWAVTAECWRVLKPSGSLFVNLGDKYAERAGPPRDAHLDFDGSVRRQANRPYRGRRSVRVKSLHGLPWRYAIGCIDGDADPEGRGWILRAELVWDKPNGLPESVDDRVRRSHEQWFHFTKAARYYSAIDELREPHTGGTKPRRTDGQLAPKAQTAIDEGMRNAGGYFTETTFNPLGKLPGSVWKIASEPLRPPAHVTVEHFAAFPSEWPRRLILGWSPSGICVECGQGRVPVTQVEHVVQRTTQHQRPRKQDASGPGSANGFNGPDYPVTSERAAIVGYACACTPYTDHPDRRRSSSTPKREDLTHRPVADLGRSNTLPPPGPPVREYHLDRWTPAPTRLAVVLDPFGGTGTTAMVARALGRIGLSVDLSTDYCRLARWRIFDSPGASRARERTNRDRQGTML